MFFCLFFPVLAACLFMSLFFVPIRVAWSNGYSILLQWGGIRLESLSAHHCWALGKYFIPILKVWSVTHSAEKTKTKRATVNSQTFCLRSFQIKGTRTISHLNHKNMLDSKPKKNIRRQSVFSRSFSREKSRL